MRRAFDEREGELVEHLIEHVMERGLAAVAFAAQRETLGRKALRAMQRQARRVESFRGEAFEGESPTELFGLAEIG